MKIKKNWQRFLHDLYDLFNQSHTFLNRSWGAARAPVRVWVKNVLQSSRVLFIPANRSQKFIAPIKPNWLEQVTHWRPLAASSKPRVLKDDVTRSTWLRWNVSLSQVNLKPSVKFPSQLAHTYSSEQWRSAMKVMSPQRTQYNKTIFKCSSQHASQFNLFSDLGYFSWTKEKIPTCYQSWILKNMFRLASKFLFAG